MRESKFVDQDWTLSDSAGRIPTWENVQIAVLMDIRDQLKQLNSLLHCPNFTSIPHTLTVIGRNTTKPKRRKRPATGKKS